MLKFNVKLSIHCSNFISRVSNFTSSVKLKMFFSPIYLCLKQQSPQIGRIFVQKHPKICKIQVYNGARTILH